ncbi:hypothetical protein VA596_11530 [Amycolatopsis sp., V23-08]|uniref:Uncharacterized protein n=1 Tax=Amycolatopsis heterodermiae TaxID=3110235 RepID=A0ABU5R1X1_9PSEU|nr:hypothetical protein [Amycolatopsis sp., V23-08]MEA5360168.1 hypothetical protein [Amycolatopsis sp., V23-08]
MTSAAGHRLLAFLRALPAATTWTVVTDEIGDLSRWRLSGSTWRAVVDVEPRRWLGMQFEAWEPATGRRATYDIDTDLYDISRDEQREFAGEIERDILEFLGNLRNRAVLRGTDGSKFVLVFPQDGAQVRVVRGRFMTTVSTRAAAWTGGALVPVA